MRGGTTSSSTDAAIAAFMADTESRRAEQDAHVQLARDGAAVRRTVDLGQPMTHPQVVLYFDLGGEWEGYMAADIVIDPETGYGKLILVCPRCLQRGRPQTMSQIHIDQRNRKWHLDTKTSGTPFIDYNNDGTASPIVLAGTVECEERCVCPNEGCDFLFRISSNTNLPNGASFKPGTSRLVREWR